VEGGVGVGLVGHGAKQAVAVVADLLDQQALAQHQPLEILLLVGLCVVCRVVRSMSETKEEGRWYVFVGGHAGEHHRGLELFFLAHLFAHGMLGSHDGGHHLMMDRKKKKKKNRCMYLIAGRS
jgi:hypothetical protein